MRAVLETRRKAAAMRVDELEAELKRVRADLADAEEVLKLRTIGLEQYLEALAEENSRPGQSLARRRGRRRARAVRCRIDRTRPESKTCRWTTRR